MAYVGTLIIGEMRRGVRCTVSETTHRVHRPLERRQDVHIVSVSVVTVRCEHPINDDAASNENHEQRRVGEDRIQKGFASRSGTPRILPTYL